MRSTVFALSGAAALLASFTAHAELPSLDVRTFRPSTDPAAGLSLEPVAIAPPWAFGMASFVHYSYRPVTLRRTSDDQVVSRPLDHVLGGDFIFNLALRGAALGVAIPYVFAQTGDKGLPANVSSVDRAPLAAIGDVAIEAKSPFVNYDTAGFGLGSKARLTLPSGDRTSYAGAGSTRVELHLLAEYSLIVASAHASVGYVSRFDRVTWPQGSGVTIGDELPWALGFRVRPKLFGLDEGDRQVWEVAARGSLPAGPVGPFGSGDPGSAQLSPVLVGVSDRIALGHTRDMFATAGADIGVTSALGVPAFRFIVGVGWTPREHDQDRDGVRDDLDQCPEIAEDRDGFEDDDGCPEIDNDDDGVLDAEDRCPMVAGAEQPGPRNGCAAPDDDKDGVANDVDACPKDAGVTSTEARFNGCPAADKDGDGIPDMVDRCPSEPEDKDGNADEDGCPDPDDDGDGIPDRGDACPKERGEPSSDPTKNGCAVHDRDGDTFADAEDQCPDGPEAYNGFKDEDGCPDEGGTALVRIDTRAARTSLRLAKPVKLEAKAAAPTVEPASMPTLRAIAFELHRHRDFTLTIGARPTSAKEADVAIAQARALAIAKVVRELTRRENAAEIVAWDSVKNEPNAASGLGFGVVVAPSQAPTGAPAPAPSPGASPAPSPAASPAPPPGKPQRRSGGAEPPAPKPKP